MEGVATFSDSMSLAYTPRMTDEELAEKIEHWALVADNHAAELVSLCTGDQASDALLLALAGEVRDVAKAHRFHAAEFRKKSRRNQAKAAGAGSHQP
jgi:hypothetical protein